MRFYLLLAILFIIVFWDIAQNQGRFVRLAGAWFAEFLRAIGVL